MIEDDTLANITARSIIGGFAQPGQAALLQPYTPRYFEAISGVWERRSSEVAQTVVVGLYPSWDISEAALDAAARFLDGDVPPALRRLVQNGVQLRSYSNEIMDAAYKAAEALYVDESAKNPAFKKMFDAYRAYQKTQNQWFGVAELRMDQFLRSRIK